MNECHKLRKQLIAEAAACGEEIHDGYYLFESYEDIIDGWPTRSEHDDLAYDKYCEACATSRVAHAHAAGLPVRDPHKPWYDQPDDIYEGPFREFDNESDSVRWCADCGKVLSFSPTNYCLEEEIDVYRELRPIYASDLLVLSELLYGADCSDHQAELLSVSSEALKRLEVPARQEMMFRLPTLAKIKSAWKELCHGSDV